MYKALDPASLIDLILRARLDAKMAASNRNAACRMHRRKVTLLVVFNRKSEAVNFNISSEEDIVLSLHLIISLNYEQKAIRQTIDIECYYGRS